MGTIKIWKTAGEQSEREWMGGWVDAEDCRTRTETHPTMPASKEESGPPPYRFAMIQPGRMVAAPSGGILLLSAAFQCGCHIGLIPWGRGGR